MGLERPARPTNTPPHRWRHHPRLGVPEKGGWQQRHLHPLLGRRQPQARQARESRITAPSPAGRQTDRQTHTQAREPFLPPHSATDLVSFGGGTPLGQRAADGRAVKRLSRSLSPPLSSWRGRRRSRSCHRRRRLPHPRPALPPAPPTPSSQRVRASQSVCARARADPVSHVSRGPLGESDGLLVSRASFVTRPAL